jgi:hypothetical protein
MKMKASLFLFLLLLTSANLWAQTEDFGVWTTIGAEKKLGKWNIGTEAELRTNSNAGQVSRWSLRLETSYNIIKPLKVGGSYQYIDFYDSKYADFQPRHRFFLYLQGKQKLGNFIFTLRERVQVTTKDESDRIKASGNIDTYKINPEWNWRNRLKAEYNIPHFPVSPSFSIESFYQLNNPDGNSFNNMRYALGFKYKPMKRHEFELYGLFDKEMNVNNPVKKYVVGIGYVYSL